MKASTMIITSIASLAIANLNTSCQESEAAAAKAEAPMAENGAQFKKGEGISLTGEMQSSIGLKVEDVIEEKVGTTTKMDLTASGTNTASGWITPAQAAMIKPGMEVTIRKDASAPAVKGTVERVDAAPLATSEAEITVTTGEPLTAGTQLQATLESAATEAVAAIPASALLKTAEGTFVYTVNGKFFVRTPVTIGSTNDKHVEIKEGLYTGDQVVSTPVMSLWMAELQVLRGGKACTCGH
ncbi:MAG: efflux RND transporter periplasmic adaptor subunit [Verrucomicrobiaceae bacterium]|nr:MAG: efflux RND transporter periplasmic adaptor subunit [Verrucomicrobiaceae bacterium]